MAFEPHILSFHILAPNTCGPCHPLNPYCFLEPSGVQFSPVPPVTHTPTCPLSQLSGLEILPFPHLSTWLQTSEPHLRPVSLPARKGGGLLR